jgi:hypothetical protein
VWRSAAARRRLGAWEHEHVMRGRGRWAVVVLDGLARLGVVGVLVVVMWLIVDTRYGAGSDGSGMPMGAVVPVAAYLVWNVGFVVWLVRRVAADGGLTARTLRIVGVAAVVRLVWVVPVARDPWWAGWPLSVVVVLAVAALAAVGWALVQVRAEPAAG